MYEIHTINEKPRYSGTYLCLATYNLYGEAHSIRMLEYEIGYGWLSDGYYFEDDFGVTLLWSDVNLVLDDPEIVEESSRELFENWIKNKL